MKYKKRILVFSLIFILTFSFAVSAGPQDKIRDMNFKNAETVDVLRAIAEVADVNLITDSDVTGTTTVHLRDITFQKALDLITQTRGLTYKWDENTIVVAPPERIDSIYANIVTEFVSISSNNIDDIAVIVKDIFPDTQITVDSLRRQFILKGEEQRVNEVKEMIKRLDTTGQTVTAADGTAGMGTETQVVEEEFYTESYSVLNAELADLEEKLKQVNYNLDIRTNPLTDTLTISGKERDVKEAMSMAETYDESLEPATKVVRVDYVDTEQITEIIGKIYPDTKLHVNEKRKEVIINGAKNKLDGVVRVIEELNKPRQQVLIEARVEEITSNKLKEIGIPSTEDGINLSRIHFIKDKSDPEDPDGNKFGQIEEIELTWPDFFSLLEEDNASKTLANPRLMTLNGEKANMIIGEEVPYKIGEDDDGTPIIEFFQAGVLLEFTPWITENDEIEIEVIPEVSNFGEAGIGTNIPRKRTRKIETRLRLNDGETFAIGGLIQSNDIENITKVPILGDIPIIGEIFKSTSNNNTKTELMIFITPRIINYGENITEKDTLFETDSNLVDSENNEEEVVTEDTTVEETQEEAVVEEKGKTKEEILEEYKNKDKEDKGFQGLTDEELQEILNK
jgi:general secretion pathway protein D